MKATFVKRLSPPASIPLPPIPLPKLPHPIGTPVTYNGGNYFVAGRQGSYVILRWPYGSSGICVEPKLQHLITPVPHFPEPTPKPAKAGTPNPNPNHTMNIKKLALSRADVFHIPLDSIAVVPDFNIRVNYGDIPALAAGLRLNGYTKPFIGRKGADDKFAITDGHRSHRAGLLAREQILKELAKPDADKKALKLELARVNSVPVQCEPPGKTDLERTLDLRIRNDGLPLSMYEDALLCRRLQEKFGLSHKEVLRKTGWTKTAVHDFTILLQDVDEQVQEYVKQGKVSGTLVVKLARKLPDKSDQLRAVEAMIAKAAEEGREQATAKHLNDADRDKVSPSRSKMKAAARAAAPAPAPAAAKPDPLILGPVTKHPVRLPKHLKVEFVILTAPVTRGSLLKGYATGIESAWMGKKEKGFEDYQPSVNDAQHPTEEDAFIEGLNCIIDLLDDYIRLKGPKAKGREAAFIKGLDEVTGLIEVAVKVAKAARTAATPAAKADETKFRVLVTDPDATLAPVPHIIALRDKLKGDDRSKDSINHDRFRTLNFVADYLAGGRYTAAEFEQFFTEFFFGKDK